MHRAFPYTAELKPFQDADDAWSIELRIAFGAILLTENERSVYARYKDCGPGNAPGTIGEDAAGYRFKEFGELLNLPMGKQCAWILNGCRCFDYQACETDNYQDTLAHLIIEAIQSAAIRALPHIEDAPWEINRKVKA